MKSAARRALDSYRHVSPVATEIKSCCVKSCNVFLLTVMRLSFFRHPPDLSFVYALRSEQSKEITDLELVVLGVKDEFNHKLTSIGIFKLVSIGDP